MKKAKISQVLISEFGIDPKPYIDGIKNKTIANFNVSVVATTLMQNLIEMFRIASKDPANEKQITEIILEISENSKIWVKKLSKNTNPEIKVELKKNKSNLKDELEQLLLKNKNELS